MLAWCGLSFEASLGDSAAALGGVRPCSTFTPLPVGADGCWGWKFSPAIKVRIIPLARAFWRG
jgi:hypothetical protein